MKTHTLIGDSEATTLHPATTNVLSFRGSRLAYWAALPAVILLLAISMCFTTDAAAQQAAAQSSAMAGHKIPDVLLPASLTASLDSKKKKVGDEVVLKSVAIVHLADGRLIPRGAKIVGHVTQATSRSGSESQSSLGIVFDKIDLADGSTLPVNGKILAVAPNPNPSDSAENGGVGYGGMNQTLQHATPTAGGVDKVVPILTEDSVGVQGIKNLQLSDGVFKSDQKTVKLGFGSQIVLRAEVTAGS